MDTALTNGVPNIRWIDVPRMGTGEERVATFIKHIEKALTAPLTAKEKETGMYSPPPERRIIFEGTLDDAQEFYQQTTIIDKCGKCPIAKFTDGAPIIIPTEEKVAEMLTGTSRSPEEVITVQHDYRALVRNRLVKAGSKAIYARSRTTTVEKVATIAVMAGCKPEYLPVVLAIATAGGASTHCPGTSSAAGYMFVVSGPIAKEIGMNVGQNALDVGNPANMTISRTAALMTINFGQCITGITRSDAGNPMHNVVFAEDDERLPPGWETLREEEGFKRDESIVMKVGGPGFYGTVQEYAPSSFRGLIGEGYGGMARRLGVEGTPGPHNFLEYVAPLNISSNGGSKTFIMHPNMANSLKDYGFKTKKAVYQWLWDTYFMTVGDYEKYGWYDFITAGGERIEPISKKKYKDLPDDHKLHVFGRRSPKENLIIVGNGFADELCWQWSRGRGYTLPIDPWK